MFERPSTIPAHFIELTLPVVKEFSSWRADRFVCHKIPRLSRNRVQKILRSLAFDQNGRAVKPNRNLKTGDIIILYKEPPDEPDVNTDFTIIYEDEWYIAVDKPPGLPVHPTARYLKNTLTHLLALRFKGETPPTLVHRLDSETSGIVLCAKTKDAERKGKLLFEQRKIKKQYKALVRGVVNPSSGIIDAPLAPNPNTIIKARMWCGSINGQQALTEYKTVKSGNNKTFLLLKPRTGRQHQLRVHLNYIGHTIIGDKLYGDDEEIFLDYMQDGLTDDIVKRAGHFRHALHAFKLEFVHPFTNNDVVIECSVPDDIKYLIDF